MKSKIFSRLSILILGCLLSANALADVNDAGVKVKWSYLGNTGPIHWGMLSPDFELCDTGKSQSPINISRKKSRIPYDLKIKYNQASTTIGEDIDTTVMIGDTQTVFNDGHTIQVNFEGKPVEEMMIGGKKYKLLQFHLHSPSETLWHKQDFPLEIHFVHQGKDGSLAVLAVLVKGGAENTALNTILHHIPKEIGSEHAISGVRINPADLLPSDKRYYAYNGSLTTPPCSEGVQWIVMSDPITATPAQIMKIRQEIGGNNARPVKPLNDRVLYYAVP